MSERIVLLPRSEARVEAYSDDGKVYLAPAEDPDDALARIIAQIDFTDRVADAEQRDEARRHSDNAHSGLSSSHMSYDTEMKVEDKETPGEDTSDRLVEAQELMRAAAHEVGSISRVAAQVTENGSVQLDGIAPEHANVRSAVRNKNTLALNDMMSKIMLNGAAEALRRCSTLMHRFSETDRSFFVSLATLCSRWRVMHRSVRPDGPFRQRGAVLVHLGPPPDPSAHTRTVFGMGEHDDDTEPLLAPLPSAGEATVLRRLDGALAVRCITVKDQLLGAVSTSNGDASTSRVTNEPMQSEKLERMVEHVALTNAQGHEIDNVLAEAETLHTGRVMFATLVREATANTILPRAVSVSRITRDSLILEHAETHCDLCVSFVAFSVDASDERDPYAKPVVARVGDASGTNGQEKSSTWRKALTLALRILCARYFHRASHPFLKTSLFATASTERARAEFRAASALSLLRPLSHIFSASCYREAVQAILDEFASANTVLEMRTLPPNSNPLSSSWEVRCGSGVVEVEANADGVFIVDRNSAKRQLRPVDIDGLPHALSASMSAALVVEKARQLSGVYESVEIHGLRITARSSDGRSTAAYVTADSRGTFSIHEEVQGTRDV